MLENLTMFEKEQVLRFLLHHMSMELRFKLMDALPGQYNRLCGRPIMRVEKVDPIDNVIGEAA